MSHMPASLQPSGTYYTLTYTATGLEGTDFPIPLGRTMANATYTVFPASAGGTSGDGTQSSGVPVIDLPTASRTSTQFRVVLGQALAAGDVLTFFVIGTVLV